ncbi:MAG: hypothetical protein KAU28_07105 [Phycisphaerae bacterium]|nr:hypothetical protein [Phycisphaerae bacterium]
MRVFTTLSLAVVALSACSCRNYSTPVVRREPTPAERNFEALWQASQEVLGEYYFTLDRLDRRAGVITTEPITGKHFFEFWRHDAAGNFDLAEGTIQTIYRIAKVTIRPVAGGAAYQAAVEIRVERSDQLTSQVTSTSEAYDMFILPGAGRERAKYLLDYGRDELGEERGGVVPLDRDRKLERILEAKIAAAAAKRVVR